MPGRAGQPLLKLERGWYHCTQRDAASSRALGRAPYVARAQRRQTRRGRAVERWRACSRGCPALARAVRGHRFTANDCVTSQRDASKHVRARAVGPGCAARGRRRPRRGDDAAAQGGQGRAEEEAEEGALTWHVRHVGRLCRCCCAPCSVRGPAGLPLPSAPPASALTTQAAMPLHLRLRLPRKQCVPVSLHLPPRLPLPSCPSAPASPRPHLSRPLLHATLVATPAKGMHEASFRSRVIFSDRPRLAVAREAHITLDAQPWCHKRIVALRRAQSNPSDRRHVGCTTHPEPPPTPAFTIISSVRIRHDHHHHRNHCASSAREPHSGRDVGGRGWSAVECSHTSLRPTSASL